MYDRYVVLLYSFQEYCLSRRILWNWPRTNIQIRNVRKCLSTYLYTCFRSVIMMPLKQVVLLDNTATSIFRRTVYKWKTGKGILPINTCLQLVNTDAHNSGRLQYYLQTLPCNCLVARENGPDFLYWRQLQSWAPNLHPPTKIISFTQNIFLFYWS